MENNGQIMTQRRINLRFKRFDLNFARTMRIKIIQPDFANSNDFRFAAAVAEIGLLLRDSQYKQKANYKDVISLAKSAPGKDDGGSRADFVTLAENFKKIDKQDRRLLDVIGH